VLCTLHGTDLIVLAKCLPFLELEHI
jgi:hypothetical protein